MRWFVLIITLLNGLVSLAQSDILAKEYFDKAQFDKAIIAYEDLMKINPNNYTYFNNLVASYQALKQYDKSEKLIIEFQKRTKQPNLYVDLGYNYQLQNNTKKAQEEYQKAIASLEENVNYASSVAYAFEQKQLLQQALEIYKKAETKNENLNFDYQKGRIYGQLGDLDQMIESFLTYAYKIKNATVTIQNQLSYFMNEQNPELFITSLRKSLLSKAQKGQDIYWNEFLSWFFVQQKQYDKAFVQEKAIYKRESTNFYNILNLAELASDDKDFELAKQIYEFVLENNTDINVEIQVNTLLIQMRIDTATTKDFPTIEKEIETLLEKYGKNSNTINLQLMQARFLAFKLEKPQQSQKILVNLLEQNVHISKQAEIKMSLADIYLYEEKFNQALIYYSQVEHDMKNSEIGNQANFKIAQTSYYKGDFDWALKQLTVLKSTASQLIANDALDLYLTINDVATDSTKIALKQLANVDFMIYKNQDAKAKEKLFYILNEFKEHQVMPIAIYRLGQLFEKEGNYNKALEYYLELINKYPENIFKDEALFYAAKIYQSKLNDILKAKELYEQIIFKHQDSIFYVDAQKEYRILRGDNL